MHKGTWIHMGFMGWCAKLALPEHCCPVRTAPGHLAVLRRADGKTKPVYLDSMLSGATAGRGEIWTVKNVQSAVQPAVQKEFEMSCKTYLVQMLGLKGEHAGYFTDPNNYKNFESAEAATKFIEKMVAAEGKYYSGGVIFEAYAKVEREVAPMKVTRIC